MTVDEVDHEVQKGIYSKVVLPAGDAFRANAESFCSLFNVLAIPKQGKSLLLHVGTDCMVYHMYCSHVERG